MKFTLVRSVAHFTGAIHPSRSESSRSRHMNGRLTCFRPNGRLVQCHPGIASKNLTKSSRRPCQRLKGDHLRPWRPSPLTARENCPRLAPISTTVARSGSSRWRCSAPATGPGAGAMPAPGEGSGRSEPVDRGGSGEVVNSWLGCRPPTGWGLVGPIGWKPGLPSTPSFFGRSDCSPRAARHCVS